MQFYYFIYLFIFCLFNYTDPTSFFRRFVLSGAGNGSVLAGIKRLLPSRWRGHAKIVGRSPSISSAVLCHCRAPIHGKGGNFISSVLMCKRRDTCPWWALVPCRHTTIRLLLSTSKKDNLSFSRNPEQTLLVHTRHRFGIPNSDRQILKGKKKEWYSRSHPPLL